MAPKPEEIPVGTVVGNDDALKAVAGTILKVNIFSHHVLSKLLIYIYIYNSIRMIQFKSMTSYTQPLH